MLLLTNMRAYLFILTLFIVGSFATGGTTAFAQEHPCASDVTACDECAVTCDNDNAACTATSAWGKKCTEIGGFIDESTGNWECEVLDEEVSKCSQLPQPVALKKCSATCDTRTANCQNYVATCNANGTLADQQICVSQEKSCLKYEHVYSCKTGDVAQCPSTPIPTTGVPSADGTTKMCGSCTASSTIPAAMAACNQFGANCFSEDGNKQTRQTLSDGSLRVTCEIKNVPGYSCPRLPEGVPGVTINTDVNPGDVKDTRTGTSIQTPMSGGTAAPGKFSPMVGIPGVSGNYTLPQLINALYKLLIMIGAVIGVTKIAIAGVKYATTDIVSAKGDAKKDIQGVLTGLLILMAPYIILTIINENFTNLNVLNSLGSGTTNTTPSNSGTFQGAPSADKYTEQCSTTCTETNGTSYKCTVFRNQCTAGAGQPDTKTTCAGNGSCEHVCKMVPGTNCPTFNLPTDDGGNKTPNTNQPKAPTGTFCFSCVAGVDADCPSKLQTACSGGEIFRPEASGPLYQCYMNGKSCPANPFITL